MKQTLYLGTAPPDVEIPQHIGTFKIARLWRQQLQAHWATTHTEQDLSALVKLLVKHQEAELGDYYEVVCVFDDTNEHALSAAFWLEANCPVDWDSKHKVEYQNIVGALYDCS